MADTGSINFPKSSTGGIQTPASTNIKLFASLDGDLRAMTDTAEFSPIMPRKTTAQRDLLSPFEGMSIWNTDYKLPQFHNGTDWVFFDGAVFEAINGEAAAAMTVGQLVRPNGPNDNEVELTSAITDDDSVGVVIFGAASGGTVLLAQTGYRDIDFGANTAVTGYFVEPTVVAGIAESFVAPTNANVALVAVGGTGLQKCWVNFGERV